MIGLSTGDTIQPKSDCPSGKEERGASFLAPHIGDLVYCRKDT
jgi:hypothetical protein